MCFFRENDRLLIENADLSKEVQFLQSRISLLEA